MSTNQQQQKEVMYKVFFTAEKELVQSFDQVAKAKGMKRKEYLIKFMQKVVKKNQVLLEQIKTKQVEKEKTK